MVYGRLIAARRLRYPRYRSLQNDFAIAFARRDRHPHNTCPTTSTRQGPGRTPELTSATSTSSGATRIHRNGHDGESRRRSIRADTFRDEGLYAFRFDRDQTHVQNFEVRRAFGSTAGWWNLIAAGHTGHLVETATGVKAFAGLAPDLFAGDATVFGEFRAALFEKERSSAQAMRRMLAGRTASSRTRSPQRSFGTQNRRRHRPPQSGLDRSDSDDRPRCWDTPLQNRWCKCILVVDQVPVPYRGISNWRWLWWRDRFHNLPDADNASHPAIVVDDR
jgi:hypothetical protein